jgi:hypothetical protein
VKVDEFINVEFAKSYLINIDPACPEALARVEEYNRELKGERSMEIGEPNAVHPNCRSFLVPIDMDTEGADNEQLTREAVARAAAQVAPRWNVSFYQDAYLSEMARHDMSRDIEKALNEAILRQTDMICMAQRQSVIRVDENAISWRYIEGEPLTPVDTITTSSTGGPYISIRSELDTRPIEAIEGRVKRMARPSRSQRKREKPLPRMIILKGLVDDGPDGQ